jgi:hypothetical protein
MAFVLCALWGVLPAAAGGYATVAPPPVPSATSGLPDGRVYEEVSPPDKHGYQAGAAARAPYEPHKVNILFSVASPDGNAVAFGSSGPAGETDSSGLNENFVAEYTTHGWTSRSSTARGLGQNENLSLFAEEANWREYSPDLKHLAYETEAAAVEGAPAHGPTNFYLLGANPLEQPTWLLRSVASPSLEGQFPYPNTELVGMTPNASVVYIAYEGRLLPQDASRSGWGLYESRNGTLTEAGVLPDGSVPSSGALPPATATRVETPSYYTAEIGENNPASLDNQVSEDGRRLLFVSAGELYVHKIEADESERSVLVSASQLQGHVGGAAPDGVVLFENPTRKAVAQLFEDATHEPAIRWTKSNPTYAYASPDGSHVFFQSRDQLTSAAPSGIEPKTYDFDTDTGLLEYLPGVELGGIVTAAKDGTSFVFVNGASSPRELDRWSAGPNGGSVSQIVQLPGSGFVGPGRLVSDDSALVFQASYPIAGFNNGGFEQVYDYDTKTNELSCVSCPPKGVNPSGDAYLSAIDQYEDPFQQEKFGRVVNDTRGVSSDGQQIFFASPDPLVGRDTNGDFDTYEWENGTVILISSGTSSNYSLFLDNSESGSDVFFATSDELVEGDNDGGFDVYDARVPHPGDNPPPAAVPCTGDVCQGPPALAQLLGAPPSATFNGAGNIVEQSTTKPKSTHKALTLAQKLANARRVCRKSKSKRKRAACERRARTRYGAGAATAKHDSRRGK